MSLAAGSLMMACSTPKNDNMLDQENPFFSAYETPFEVPPFEQIQNGHYLPAFKQGMEAHKAEIQKIIDNKDAATFANTIEALEFSGKLLDRVSTVFYNMMSANTNDELQSIAKEVSPLLSAHSDDINLNPALFARVKAVYEQKDKLELSEEQKVLLEKTYKGFVRGGANLAEDKQASFREINKELSMLSLKFGENVLAETNAYQLIIEDEKDLAGLPEAVKGGAASAAKAAGHEGKWLFTLQKPSMIPFLQYAENRKLREEIYTAYIKRGDNGNENDNKAIISKIASLRLKKANLLGYDSHADFILAENMAKEPQKVTDFLTEIWDAALPMAKREASELQKIIDKEGGNFKLAGWDWWFYAEKLKKQKFNLDENELRPYFQLENVLDGAFLLAEKLYGLSFTERTDIPKYHPEASVYEVKEADGTHVGLLYADFHPRASKRVGAWMTSYRKQSEGVTPVISMVCNFSEPVGDKPALLSMDEVETLFHEFGHALHGLLSNCKYNSLSGTSVARDFVELPSQVMENWTGEPEMLALYAKHYETGEVIPTELVEKVRKAGNFNQGFATVEYLAASFLDMQWHTITSEEEVDAAAFEDKAMNALGMIPEITVRYRSTYFNHIFYGGYSSGYYAYIWAEVLDADAFEAFKENGLFDKETAAKFRSNILERGGTEEAMTLYKKFRGKEPSIEPLLKKRGLLVNDKAAR
ncbi:peptidyl-dipeptidase Dcp [Sediminitomix flava]|uniref:Peptidyl-dipeptidase Dcp n=2 Tax=Sediminitomix flava TaxID=379075 RepID=A0A315Z699_SEDFL|nr:peptidyl-dipeptidase Dcp [Sediminitomix flava]